MPCCFLLGLSLALFSFQGEQEPKDREASKTVQVSVLKTSLIIIVGLLCSFILGPCFNRRNVKDKAMPKIKEASHKTIIIETSPVYIGPKFVFKSCAAFPSLSLEGTRQHGQLKTKPNIDGTSLSPSLYLCSLAFVLGFNAQEKTNGAKTAH